MRGVVRQGQGPRCGHENGCRTVRAGAEVSPAPYRLSFIRVWPIRAVNWGLRSPNSDANNAYNINTDGSVNNNNVYNANFAPRPALYLQSSILVSVETEDEEKVLADYTDTELMDELYRRRRATYDAG